MTSRLRFLEKMHAYKIDGNWAQNVTGVLNACGDKTNLFKWQREMTADWCFANVGLLDSISEPEWKTLAIGAADRHRDAAGDQGRRVHAAAEAMLWGDPLPDPVDIDGIDDAPWTEVEVAMATQVARCMDDHQLEPVYSELLVFHERHGWAGRTDLVADLRDGRRAMFDWKTSGSGIWPKEAVQVCTYAHATHMVIDGEDELMTHIDLTACIWIQPNGYQVIPTRCDAETYDLFRHMQRVARWSRAKREQYVFEPLEAPVEATA